MESTEKHVTRNLEPGTIGSKPKLLIVEDDESIRSQMRWALSQDYEVFLGEDRKTAVDVFQKEQPLVVTLDLGLLPRPNEPAEGFAALAEILGKNHLTKVIVVTGQGEKENAREAIGQGAYDFFTKPIQLQELKVVLGRAFIWPSLSGNGWVLKKASARIPSKGCWDKPPNSKRSFRQSRKLLPTMCLF